MQACELRLELLRELVDREERQSAAADAGADEPRERALLRRGSCGAEALVGPGSLWMQLALSRSDALVR